MLFSRLIPLILTLLTLPHAASAQRLADSQVPDSIVVRDAGGVCVSRSAFVVRGRETVETRVAVGGTDRKIVSRHDNGGRLTSQSEYVRKVGNDGWRFDQRTDISLSADGRDLSHLTVGHDGRQTMTAYAYDPQGRVATATTYTWDSAEVDWAPAERLDYSYSRQLLPLPSRDFAVRTRSVWSATLDQWELTADEESYDFDPLGRIATRCSHSDKTADTCVETRYDEAGRLISSSVCAYVSGNISSVGKEEFLYDRHGRLSSLRSTDSDGRLLTVATYYYSSRPPRNRAESESRLASVETTEEKGGRRVSLQTFYYDSIGRMAGVAVDSLGSSGEVSSRHEKAFVYSPSGHVQRTIEAVIAPRDSSYEFDVDDIPFDSYAVTLLDEAAQPVHELHYELSGDSACESGPSYLWRNAYDASGRLASSVRSAVLADGSLVRLDSVAVVYDVVTPPSSHSADSASLVGRVWLRLAGFFGGIRRTATRDAQLADSAVVGDERMAQMTERLVYRWDGGWQIAEKIKEELDAEGRIAAVYSYQKDVLTPEWRIKKKEVRTYNGAKPERVEVYAPAAEGGRLELVGVGKFHYY